MREEKDEMEDIFKENEKELEEKLND